jgi:hypothetical protein
MENLKIQGPDGQRQWRRWNGMEWDVEMQVDDVALSGMKNRKWEGSLSEGKKGEAKRMAKAEWKAWSPDVL